ncbi:SRPBCC family protein [Actinokineospora sp.]|uniref:SRPBCC family protein n=1 Tax=Actinokineospora sp. TaxID=1872133 RepID=UPI0040383474
MIDNMHRRDLPVDPTRAGELLDRIVGTDSPLWPTDTWPPLLLDRPLGVGAAGGHGPIRYTCTAYTPGRLVEFTFAPGLGVRGTHTLEVLDGPGGTSVLRHVLRGRPEGTGRAAWPLAIRWLHDALLEDLLDRAAAAVGHPPARRARWSPWVRVLRRLVGGRKVGKVDEVGRV